MGMFDSVYAPCPDCGEKNEFQSKGGDCTLSTYDLYDAPADVLSDVNRHPVRCRCGTSYTIRVQCIATVERL